MSVYSKIKKIAFDIAKENKTFRVAGRLVRDAAYSAKMILDKPFGDCDEKLVYFQTFSGRGFSDSPRALYEYMMKSYEYREYKFVWSFREPEKYRYLENDRTRVVKFRSKEDNIALRTAKYWISNYRMLDYQHPGKNQVYVQCWHGTPLKRLGYDIEESDNSMNSLQEIRHKYRTDAKKFSYLLSPSPFATEKFATAWNLIETGQTDKIIEIGYPRNDRLIRATEDERLKLRQILDIPEGKRVILYAPTWRDNQHTSGKGYTYKVEVDFDKLKDELQDDFVILFRAHYLVANSFDFDRYDGFVRDVSGYDDINDLYIASDILVTDYSSVFFDYANLNRPMIFYMYDLDQYEHEMRGFYISLDELPGRIAREEESLIKTIRECKKVDLNKELDAFHVKFNPLDDGDASKRLAETVIG